MPRSKEATKELRSSMSDDAFVVSPTSRAAEEIADHIQRLIISQSLDQGARLPSERDLAQLLSTSRPTVSQAIRILVVRGLVESRRGSGSYVLRRPQDGLATSVELMVSLDEGSIPKLAQLRLWLETTGAVEAAAMATDTEIAEIGELCEGFRAAAGDVARFMTVDTRFHAALVSAAHNPYLASIYESVHTTLINYEYRSWIEAETVPAWLERDAYARLIAIHQPIVDALIARDSDAMRAAVLSHHVSMAGHLRESVRA